MSEIRNTAIAELTEIMYRGLTEKGASEMSLVQQSTAMAEKARDFYAQKLVEYEMKYQHPKNSQSAAYFGISEVLTGRENEFEFVPEPDEFELGEDVTEIGSKPVSRDPLIKGLLD